jgi:hypothetical protein
VAIFKLPSTRCCKASGRLGGQRRGFKVAAANVFRHP